ncbi:hypothetical protein QL285_022984 [Trifolium repens]|nr:hypothetical protein QL285_022984 [Trifolium repens]
MTSMIKGKKVKITEERIRNLLNVPDEGQILYGSSWFQNVGIERSDVIASMVEEETDSIDPPSSKLKTHYKMLHNMCLHSIFPRKGSKDKVTDNDLMIMYHLGNNIKINLPYILLQHMIYTAESGTKKNSLPYGMILTKFFIKDKVNLDEEESSNSVPTFSFRNVERMKNPIDLEEKDAEDHGKKRKREAFEQHSSLDDLADLATAQEDDQETIVPDPPVEDHQETSLFDPPATDKGKSVSEEPPTPHCTTSSTISQQFNIVSMPTVSTNPINISTFSSVMSSQKTFESFHPSDFIRNVLNSPIPTMPFQTFADAGPSMPSIPPLFGTLNSFCTNTSDAVNQEIPIFDPPPIPNPDTRSPKKSSLEKDVAKIKKSLPKMFAAMNAHNSAMQYMLGEWQALRTWLGNTYCHGLPENTLPPPNFVFPSFESDNSSSDES